MRSHGHPGQRAGLHPARTDGKRRKLTDEPGRHYVQSWSPDGAWLAVLSYSPDCKSSRTRALRISDGRWAELETLPGARDLVWRWR